jgi:uncharacterized membrane-anchored protein YhcB (DUF1043 family)
MKSKSISPKWALILFSLLVGMAIGAIFLFTSFSIYPLGDYSYIGATISGITAPFLTVAGSLLVYFSFRAQTEANHELSENIRQNQMLREYDQIYGLIKTLIDDYQHLRYDASTNPNTAINKFLKVGPIEASNDDNYKSFLRDFAYVMESADFSSRKIFYFKDQDGSFKRVLRSRVDNFFATKLSPHLDLIDHHPKFMPYFDMDEDDLIDELKSHPVIYGQIVKNIRNIRETINDHQFKT